MALPPKIGIYSFVRLIGTVQQRGLMLEPILRPGVDGEAFRAMGKRSEPFELVSVRDEVDASDAESAMLLYQGLRGTVVEVRDEHESVHPSVLVLAVQRIDVVSIAGAIGGLTDPEEAIPTKLQRVRWTLVNVAA